MVPSAPGPASTNADAYKFPNDRIRAWHDETVVITLPKARDRKAEPVKEINNEHLEESLGGVVM
jgi:hypothetical protein